MTQKTVHVLSTSRSFVNFIEAVRVNHVECLALVVVLELRVLDFLRCIERELEEVITLVTLLVLVLFHHSVCLNNWLF